VRSLNPKTAAGCIFPLLFATATAHLSSETNLSASLSWLPGVKGGDSGNEPLPAGRQYGNTARKLTEAKNFTNAPSTTRISAH
jgi:hypothetical protein